MCGLAGCFGNSANPEIAQYMADALSHRGPDDAGIWADPDAFIALAHRRLAIVDLSKMGQQPCVSQQKRYVIVFNGEIYNHQQLRKALQGVIWQGSSDTEVLLACIESWGLDHTLQRCTGMFAFALWDREQQTVTLARDRLGEKPLYYAIANNTLLFASELKAFRHCTFFKLELNPTAINLYLRYAYIPTPYSIYKSVYKLQAGSYRQFKFNNRHISQVHPERYYWQLHQVVAHAQQEKISDYSQAIRQLENQLMLTLQQQMACDVPIGAWLSGGVDSSLLVALMQQYHSSFITFSIGFQKASHDEADYARAIANYFKIEHHAIYLKPEDISNSLSELINIYDEPFGDFSQVPTLLLATLTRQFVKVALSGDGADELFCGYNRYLWLERIWQFCSIMPYKIRKLFAYLLSEIPAQYYQHIFTLLSCLLNEKMNPHLIYGKLKKLVEALQMSTNGLELYHAMLMHWDTPHIVMHGDEFPVHMTLTEQLMYLDTLGYLKDDILVKVDRASMARGVEVRTPFLDHNIVKLAWQMPLAFKFHQGKNKHILRELLYRQLPRHLVDRPKSGFAMPLGHYLRHDLYHWANARLNQSNLASIAPYVDVNLILNRWQEHQHGWRDWTHELWLILVLQAYLEKH